MLQTDCVYTYRHYVDVMCAMVGQKPIRVSGIGIKTAELCIKNADFCIKNAEFAINNEQVLG